MSTKTCRQDSLRSIRQHGALFALLFTLLTVYVLPLRSDSKLQESLQGSSSGCRLVVLVDVNPNQKKVLPIERALAKGVLQKLDNPENKFSVIAFGSGSPTLLKSGVRSSEATAALQDIVLGQPGELPASVQLYDALDLALAQFPEDARTNSLLIITEGNDGRGKMFQRAVIRAQQLQVICNVAMVATHTLYGSKALQSYGFYLRQLSGKTHGRYVEVGDNLKKVPRSVDRLSESVPSRFRR